MKFSGLIFPFPSPPTYSHDHLVGEILYVPKDFNDCPMKYMDSAKEVTQMEELSLRSAAGLTGNSLGNSRNGITGGILAEIDNINGMGQANATMGL